jgi:hypothetical protein
MLELDHQGCPSQVRDESGPRGSNGRTHSATVSDVSDSARSHDPGDLDVHCWQASRLTSMFSSEVTSIHDKHHAEHGNICVYLYVHICLKQSGAARRTNRLRLQ